MARRGPKKRRKADSGFADPQGMGAMMERYLEWLRLANYSERTVKNNRVNLGYFASWCEERGITRPQEVTRPVLIRYQRWLYHYRSEDGRPLSFRSQNVRLSPLRGFFRWLTKNLHILYNPASDLDLPRMEKRLPKHVLTQSEAERVINQVELSDPLGIRDRAILETLYSTGMRRLELIGLKLFDLDSDRGTMLIHGKGKKDRVVPIGERAVRWIEQYLHHVRPSLAVEPDHGTMFLTADGEPLSPNRLSDMVRRYVEGAGIGKTGSCHLLRHTMATLMLENGADIRFIQQILGHAHLTSTQIYTHLSIRKLKEIHTATHPASRLHRKTADGSRQTAAKSPSNDGTEAAANGLLHALAGEAPENPRE